MNDVIEAETGTALAVIRTALPTILAADQSDILGKLAEKIAAFVPDISTAKGRKECASIAAQVASAKMDLVRLGKGLTENWRKSTAAVNAECRVIEERMDALKRHVRAPLDAYEAAEEARTKANEDAIAALEALAAGLTDLTPDEIEKRQRQASLIAEFDWALEFKMRAERAAGGVVAQLRVAHQDAVRRVAEAKAEAERLAAEMERARIAAAAEQRQREERIAAEAAETARKAAEADAARRADEAAQAARNAQEAAERKAAAEVLEAEKQARQAREAAAAAQARAARAEADKIEAVAAAERAKEAAAAKAERDKAAAVVAEQKRAADAKAAEDAAAIKRAENVAHQRKINGEVLADMLVAMSQIHAGTATEAEEIAKAIIKALAKSEIRHCKIEY